MSDTSLHRVKEVYLTVADLPPEERARALDRECGGDEALRAKISRMLALRPAASSFLAGPALVAGEDLLPGALAAPPPPERVGPYRVLELLGEGGFGSVYRAEQAEPIRREVALKIIKPGMGTRAVIARFEAERQTLAMLDHPGIARVYDAGATESGQPYFAMELIRGEPITRHCDRERLPIAARLRLFVDACHAVQHAHQKGVIHRDLKPSNVMVQSAGERRVVKIIDFGIAKAIDASEGGATIATGVGQMVGTPDAMSPEQADPSLGGVDTRTDIYALGALLYELLTGVTPLGIAEARRSSLAEITRVICHQEPARPSARVAPTGAASRERAAARGLDERRLAARLRADLDWIVMKALEKDRARRYDSAAALASDVMRHLASEPVTAGPPSAAYRARKFVRRHRVAVGAGAVVLAAVAAGVAGISVALSRALAAEADSRSAREQAEAVNAFLVEDILGSAHTERIGPKVTVVEAMGDALGSVDSRFADRPVVAARIRSMIGGIYYALGMLEQAGDALRPAWEAQASLLGPDAYETLATQRQLTATLKDQGQGAEAERLIRDAIGRGAASLGPDHPLTLQSQAILGELLQQRGDHAQADPLLERTVARMRAVMAPDDLPLLAALSSLSASLSAQGRLQDAEPICAELLALARRRYPPGHPAVLSAMNNMATLLMQLGRPAEAEPLCAELLRATREALPPGHWQIAWARYSLGACLLRLGRHDEAAPQLREAYNEAAAALGEDHALTERALGSLVSALDALGDPGAVDAKLLAAETRLRIANPDQHESVVAAVREYLELDARYRPDDAPDASLRRLEDRARRMLEADHPAAANALSNLGLGLAQNGYPADGERWLLEAYERLAAQQPPDEAARRAVARRLAAVCDSLGRAADAASWRQAADPPPGG